MKYWMYAFLLLPSFPGHSQTTTFGNFKLENQEIIFQKVYEQDSITLQKLEAFYQTLPNVSHVHGSGSQLEFDMSDIKIDYAKFHFSQMGTPSVIQTGNYSGKVSVDVKNGRYRVTMKSIQLTGDIGYKKINEKDDLTNYACRNSGTVLSQDWCRPNMLGLLDQAFTDMLQYTGEDNGDW